jgi:Glycosyl transferase family 11
MFLVEEGKGMIVVRLCGGLGNQLFQYAAGRRLANARQEVLVLDLGWYARTPPTDTPRAYELGNYPIRARPATAVEALWCRLHEGRLLRRMSFLPRRWRHWREKGFEFDPAVLDLPDSIYLDGYWQSHHYFEDAADLIRADFTPIAPFGPQDEKIAALIATGDAVSVHVRRGDYVAHHPAATAHGQCSLDYYKAALVHILPHVKTPHFFVFSDDPAWARENLLLPGPSTFVDHNGPASAFQDLRLMSLCKHQITANSSFSWWGAWLNSRPDKIVIAPKQWFADPRNTDSLTPDDWLRL